MMKQLIIMKKKTRANKKIELKILINNSLFIKYVPRQSTLPYYSITIQNESYFEFTKSSDFIFNQNIFGFADTLDANDKISSINAFSLGGLSFKGFDYRGIGPLSSNYYLGGNKFVTSTVGYGSSFMFDDKLNLGSFASKRLI